MFTAVLLYIAKICAQPMSTEGGMDKEIAYVCKFVSMYVHI